MRWFLSILLSYVILAQNDPISIVLMLQGVVEFMSPLYKWEEVAINFTMQSRVNTTRPSFLGPSLGGLSVEMAAWQSVVVMARCGAAHMQASSLLTGLLACVPPLSIVANYHQVIYKQHCSTFKPCKFGSKWSYFNSAYVTGRVKNLCHLCTNEKSWP